MFGQTQSIPIKKTIILKYFFPTDCKNKETSGLHRQTELQQEGKRK